MRSVVFANRKADVKWEAFDHVGRAFLAYMYAQHSVPALISSQISLPLHSLQLSIEPLQS